MMATLLTGVPVAWRSAASVSRLMRWRVAIDMVDIFDTAGQKHLDNAEDKAPIYEKEVSSSSVKLRRCT